MQSSSDVKHVYTARASRYGWPGSRDVLALGLELLRMRFGPGSARRDSPSARSAQRTESCRSKASSPCPQSSANSNRTRSIGRRDRQRRSRRSSSECVEQAWSRALGMRWCLIALMSSTTRLESNDGSRGTAKARKARNEFLRCLRASLLFARLALRSVFCVQRSTRLGSPALQTTTASQLVSTITRRKSSQLEHLLLFAVSVRSK